MKRLLLLPVILSFNLTSIAQSQDRERGNTELVTRAKESYTQEIHLAYQPNLGQITDTEGNPRPDIKYVVQGRGMTIYFRETGISYVFTKSELPDPSIRNESGLRRELRQTRESTMKMHRVDIDFVGASPQTKQIEEEKQTYYTNYYLAHCPEGITGVPEYGKVTYEDLYPGIDWVLYLDEGQLRYDLAVEAGADLTMIQMEIQGTEDFEITEGGALEIHTPMGTITENAPEVYQAEHEIPAGYRLRENQLSFELINYDPALPLLIDPIRRWSTYLGGNGFDDGHGGATVDGNANLFVHGSTGNNDFPSTSGAHQENNAGVNDAYLAKFDSSGNELWITYYGGSDNEYGSGGCATDGSGNVFIHGYTGSSDFPVSGTHSSSYVGGNDAYLVKFDGSGSRLWATYYGGSDNEEGEGGCAVDGSGNVYIHGSTYSSSSSTTPFPTTGGAFQTTHQGGLDAYLVKFNGSGNRQWATLCGGTDNDVGRGVAIDGSNNIFINGHTESSTDFPVTTVTHQGTYGGGSWDAYLAKFNSSGTEQWISYYGGTGSDYGGSFGCAVDGSGNVFFLGHTGSNDFPTTTGAFQTIYGGSNDAYLLKFDNTGNRLWATYCGGTSEDVGNGGCAVNGNGDVFIHGRTVSSDFPVTAGAYQTNYAGSNDSYLVQFSSSGTQQYATYYGGTSPEYGKGGCVEDGNGNVLIHGTTYSDPFPTTSGAFQESYEGSGDAYMVKFDMSTSLLPIDISTFTAQYDSDANLTHLQWITSQESELDYYVVERSLDGLHFEAIGEVPAQNQPHAYRYTDSELPPVGKTIYYRLRILDLNGQDSYSEVVRVALEPTDLQLAFNPDHGQFRLLSDQQTSFHFRLFNLQGQNVRNGVSPTNQSQPVRGLPTGIYFLHVRMDDTGEVLTRKMVLAR